MSYVEPHMTKALADHTLREITPEGSPVRAFYLERNRRRAMSTLITFTPEGIHINGDLSPGARSATTIRYYGVEWFAREHSEDYLCSKFLDKEWQEEVALRDLTSLAATDPRVNDFIEEGLIQEDLREMAEELGMDLEDISHIGYDYHLGHAGWLVAIQRKFAELYKSPTLN